MDMDRYPTELRVLAVDDDRSGLRLLQQQLHLCNYNNVLSTNDDKETMVKGIKNGACDYLVKPACLDQLRNIWMHVARNKMKNAGNNVRSGKDGAGHKLRSADGENSEDGANHTKKYSKKNKKYGNQAEEDKDGTSTQKKQRVQWTGQLHHKFLEAVNTIGMDKAVPMNILKEMNVDGLTRDCVASHLQVLFLFFIS
nr:unnamed protein product [Digitaria exilis]